MIDILFLFLVVVAIVKGLSKGFIVGLFSFLAYFIGLAAALKLSSSVAQRISGMEEPSAWMPVLAFSMVFIAVVLTVNLSARFIRSIVKSSSLGWMDRLGGVAFFLIIYLFIFSILVFYASELNWISNEAKETSRVYRFIAPIGPAMVNALGKVIPFFGDLFEKLKVFFENLDKKV